ncbi:MAG: Holliday junction resolvase RuvX [Planctomycetia bacterium TMED53]|nr:MAG: Holliday junction resolvase RuvX [Planctomycetia bacterium TMED53]
MKVWIGVDPGEKRIGLARSDALGVLATPRGLAGNRQELLRWIVEVEEDFGLAGILIGCPRNMDGSFGPMALRSLELSRWLRELTEVPVRLWDERLTTRQAHGIGGQSSVDEKAAAILLQSYLDAGTPPSPDPPGLLEADQQKNDE